VRMSKNTRKKDRKNVRQNQSLLEDLQSDRYVRQKFKEQIGVEEEERKDVIPPKMSRKLLIEVKEQQVEVNTDEQFPVIKSNMPIIKFDDVSESFSQDDSYVEEITDIDPEEEAIMKHFMTDNQQKKTISDIIMEKIKEKELLMQNPQSLETKLEPKVLAVYSQVAQILSRYSSGRLPKAAKIIPMLTNWEEVLYITKPDKWTSQAVRCLTKIFASNLQEKMAEKYYSYVLLPHFRENLDTHKKLNWHLYMSLKKSLYKPKAFYKGILIPLCESGDCTLREATILSSVLKKVSIPVLPSSVAMMKIALMPYSGANSMFLKVLIDKKYALPYSVIDALVEHFLKFKEETRTLPVIWHQSLLSFSQRYKTNITAEQKTEIKFLLRKQFHHKITPETRRELFQSKCRFDVELIETMEEIQPDNDEIMDDTST